MIIKNMKNIFAIILTGSIIMNGVMIGSGEMVYAAEVTEELTSETIVEDDTQEFDSEEYDVSTVNTTSDMEGTIINDVESMEDFQGESVNIEEEEMLQGTAGSFDVENAFKLLSMINGERKKEGKTVLSMDMGLFDTAKIRAVDIVTKFSNERPDGTGWFSVYPSYQKKYISEMLAQNSNDPAKIYDEWMKSDAHKNVMFGNQFTCVGIACYYLPDSQYKYYWTLCFGDTLKTAIYQNGNDITTNAPVIYDGVDYSAVYNYNYYINKYADIKNAFGDDAESTLHHFVTAGMKEGRQACDSFNVIYYKNRYPELRRLFGNDLTKYYMHYINYGLKEGRDGKTYCGEPIVDPDNPEDAIEMYRLYNPNSGEHFYTGSVAEKDMLVSVGWKYEGVAWYAPSTGEPVYRLYNGNAGDHHYTLSEAEKDMLVSVGWKYEGVAWYSGGSVPLYRAYNPNAIAGSHHYTIDTQEIDGLASLGWKKEGIAWYAIR